MSLTEGQKQIKDALADKGWDAGKITHDQSAGWTVDVSGKGYSKRTITGATLDDVLDEISQVTPRS